MGTIEISIIYLESWRFPKQIQ